MLLLGLFLSVSRREEQSSSHTVCCGQSYHVGKVVSVVPLHLRCRWDKEKVTFLTVTTEDSFQPKTSFVTVEFPASMMGHGGRMNAFGEQTCPGLLKPVHTGDGLCHPFLSHSLIYT